MTKSRVFKLHEGIDASAAGVEYPQKCEMCNSICSKKLGIEIVEVEK